MPIKYCAAAGCGAKNEYSALSPKFCQSCGKPFAQAFASQPIVLATPVITTTTAVKEYPNALPKRDMTSTYQPANGPDSEDEDEEDYVDADEVRRQTEILASQIRSSDFIINTDKSNVFRIKSVKPEGITLD